jgi:hypothetical protein
MTVFTSINSLPKGYQTIQDPVNNKSSIIHKALRLKALEKDTVSFSSGLILPGMDADQAGKIRKEDIDSIVSNFYTQLIVLMKADQLNQDNVQQLINIITPGIKIEAVSMKELPDEKMRNSIAALFKATYSGDIVDIKLFINFNEASKTELIQSISHEFTHALQANTDEEKALITKLIKSPAGKSYPQAFMVFEREFINEVYNNQIKKQAATIDMMLKIAPAKIALNAFKKDNESFYSEMFDRVAREFEIEDTGLLLEYFKNRAENESKAYENGMAAHKSLTGEGNKLYHYDMLPLIYQDLAEFIDKELEKL